jgi:uncharacterized protein DUF6932
MTILQFTIDGILPPFEGSSPAGASDLMSPYEVGPVDVVERFGTTEQRKAILRNWLDHRTVLRGLGIDQGFQWLDGSFVEEKDPHDLDLVTFFHRPASVQDATSWRALWFGNPMVFSRLEAKQTYNLDTFFLDMDGDPEDLVSTARYLLQLFSHQRDSFLWKGMLQVRLEDTGEDALAKAFLTPQVDIVPAGDQP